MHQRDYILRIIEQLGAVLAEVRRRILGQVATTEEVERALADAAGQVGYDLDLLRGFSVETLHMFVAPTGDVEPARCWLMAEVLYLDGLSSALDDRRADAADALTKARFLYELVRPAGGTIVGLPEAVGRIEEIDERLSTLGGESLGSGPGRRLRAG